MFIRSGGACKCLSRTVPSANSDKDSNNRQEKAKRVRENNIIFSRRLGTKLG